MKISTNTTNNIVALRELRDIAKTANKNVDTQSDKLVASIIEDGIALWIELKENGTFSSYNKFIEAYNAELLSHVNENEKSLINSIGLVTFIMNKGLFSKCTMKQAKNVFKYANFITFSNLKSNKEINAEINTAKKAYEAEILAMNEKLTTLLQSKTASEIDAFREVASIVKKDVKKAEKKALKEASKA